MRKVSFQISHCKHGAWSGWREQRLCWDDSSRSCKVHGGEQTPHTESCTQLIQMCKVLSSWSSNCWGETLRETSFSKCREQRPPNRTVCLTVVRHLYPNSTVRPEISIETCRRKLASLSRRAAEVCLLPQLHLLYMAALKYNREAFLCQPQQVKYFRTGRQSLPRAIYSMIFNFCLPASLVYN